MALLRSELGQVQEAYHNKYQHLVKELQNDQM